MKSEKDFTLSQFRMAKLKSLASRGVNWNYNFTDELRRQGEYLWGNWDLAPGVKVGAIGALHLDKTVFQRYGTLSSSCFETDKVDVMRNFDVAAGGSTTHTVSAGVNSEYTVKFKNEGALRSTGVIRNEEVMRNPKDVVRKNLDNIATLAKEAGYYDEDSGQVLQGFGVVTSVTYSASGSNTGGQSDESEFKLSGDLSQLQKLLGLGGTVDIKGEYSYSSVTKNTTNTTWPASGGESLSQPLWYQFVSFYKGEPLLWNGALDGISLKLENHSTYVVYVVMSYSVGGEQRVVEDTLCFGFDRKYDDIPVDAKNLSVTLEFVCVGSNKTAKKTWPNPLGLWPGKKHTVVIEGAWPSDPEITW